MGIITMAPVTDAPSSDPPQTAIPEVTVSCLFDCLFIYLLAEVGGSTFGCYHRKRKRMSKHLSY